MSTAIDPPRTHAVPDPVTAQRIAIYVLTVVLVAVGILLAMAFKEPCPPRAMQVVPCQATLASRLPAPSTWVALGATLAMMILMFELRWYVRWAAVGVLGAGQLVLCGLSLWAGLAIPLVVAHGVVGTVLIACAVGIWLDRRVAWAVAASMCGTLTLVYFFGSAKVQSATGMPLGWAILPALAAYLPVTVALALTPPGAPRYAPFATRPE
jgi:hypothetical protein